MGKRSVYGPPTVANDPSVAELHLLTALSPAVLQLVAELSDATTDALARITAAIKG